MLNKSMAEKKKRVTLKSKRQEILEYWNSQGIIVHRRMNHELELEIARMLKYYSADELKASILLYATILEAGTPEDEKKYFWTYKWNLYEFLKRGVKKFEGREASDYLKKQKTATPEAVIIKRK